MKLQANDKISLFEALERLSQAKDGEQLKQRLGGLYRVNQEYPEVIHRLELIERVFYLGRRNR